MYSKNKWYAYKLSIGRARRLLHLYPGNVFSLHLLTNSCRHSAFTPLSLFKQIVTLYGALWINPLACNVLVPIGTCTMLFFPHPVEHSYCMQTVQVGRPVHRHTGVCCVHMHAHTICAELRLSPTCKFALFTRFREIEVVYICIYCWRGDISPLTFLMPVILFSSIWLPVPPSLSHFSTSLSLLWPLAFPLNFSFHRVFASKRPPVEGSLVSS